MRILFEVFYIVPILVGPFLLTKFLKPSLKTSILFCVIGLFIGLYIALTAIHTSFFVMKLDLLSASILFHLNLAISGIIVGPIIFLISTFYGKNLLADPIQSGTMFRSIYTIAIPVLYAGVGFLIGLIKTKL